MLRKFIIFLAISSLVLLVIYFGFKWATGNIVTDYSNCVSSKLTFQFKKSLNLYIIDDSKSKGSYSSMNLPKGEHFICISEDDRCIRGYYKELNMIPLRSVAFHLSGKYKTNIPNFLLAAFAPSTGALQANIAGKKVWLAAYNLDKDSLTKSSYESYKALHSLANLSDKASLDFQCPNSDTLEEGWVLNW